MKHFFYLIKKKLKGFFFQELKITFRANEQLQKENDGYHAIGSDPFFYIVSEDGFLSKWIRLNIALDLEFPVQPYLYFDRGEGFSELDKMALPIDIDGYIDYLLRLPDDCQHVRFDPMSREGYFKLKYLRWYRATKFAVLALFLRKQWLKIIKLIWSNFFSNKKLPVRRIIIDWLSSGINLLSKELCNITENYTHWVHYNDRYLLSKHEVFEKKSIQSRFEFLIVILLPKFETAHFEKLKHSLQKQYYQHWQAIIVTTNTTLLKPLVKDDQRFQLLESDVGSMSSKCNQFVFNATDNNSDKEKIVIFIASGGQLSPFALTFLTTASDKKPLFKIAYADEDYIDDQGKRYKPQFKPNWDPFLLQSQNYFGAIVAYEINFFCQIGGLKQSIENSPFWELALRASRVVDAEKICHIPAILSHRNEQMFCSGEPVANEDSKVVKQFLLKHLEELGTPAVDITFDQHGYCRVQYELKQKVLVSIIIPTKNEYRILKQCIDSIVKLTSYTDYEIIVIDNQSDELECLEYFQHIEGDRIRIIKYDKPFNYSAINNLAVEYAQGEVLFFLNNDVEVINPEWLTEMLQLVMLPHVGAVGAKLLFPDGSIQHAGVFLGFMGVAGHLFSGSSESLELPLGRMQIVQSYTAVTAACLAVKKQDFLTVKGFNENELTVAFNDVDLCLKLYQAGLINLWTPHAVLYHYESLTRGYEDTPEKLKRFTKEIAYMKKHWSAILENDPMYNVNLSLEHLEFQFAEKIRGSI